MISKLPGVPAAAIKQFSRRTAQIEHARRNAALRPETKGRLGAKTREKRITRFSWNALRAEWNGAMKDKDSEASGDTHRRETSVCTRGRGGERSG